ncbi:MAG: hypothetical protein Q9186_003757 [Xanthomendoza sp. 1 TL-2023]
MLHLLSLLLVHLFLPTLLSTTEASLLAPTNLTLHTPHPHIPHSAGLQFPPRKAPKLPWNEYFCRNSGISANINLTFTFWSPLSRGSARIAIAGTKRILRERIAAGHGDRSLPGIPTYVISYQYRTRIAVTIRHVQSWGIQYALFNAKQALQALELLEYCGVEREIYEEMWACVFEDGRLIGYIWMELLLVSEGGNGIGDLRQVQ